MKRPWPLLVIIAIAAATIIVLALRHKEVAATATVATLLPPDTVLLIHIPDIEKNRDAWQRTDLYQLYHEPAVKDFLLKPLAQVPKKPTEGPRPCASLATP